MCTSNVADNTQRLVSMGKLHKVGYGLSMQWQGVDKDVVEVTVLAYAWRCQNGEVDDVETLAKMSGGDVDVEPFLVSRNTLGNDEP